jgi:hypothetical protein
LPAPAAVVVLLEPVALLEPKALAAWVVMEEMAEVVERAVVVVPVEVAGSVVLPELAG